MQLRQYQIDAVAAIHAGEARYLAADAGLGKTRMAMEIAKLRGAKTVLYFCPASVKLAVVADLKKWRPEWKFTVPRTVAEVGKFKTHDVLWTIINYDKVSRGQDFVTALIQNGPYDMLVLDEAHYLKSFMSRRTRRIYREIMPVCNFTLPMSATPMPNNASELYAPLRHMAPERITKANGGIMRQDEFEDRYCQVSQRYVGGPRPVRQITGSRNMEDLKRRLGGFFLRLKKSDHLKELPPMQFELEYIGAHVPRDLSFDLPENLSDDEFLALVNGDHEHIARAMRVIEVSKAVPAGQYVQDFLTDNNKKVVVWAKHHDAIDGLRDYLDSAKIKSVKIDGRNSMKEREDAVKSFLENPETRVFVGQINAAGTGLTLLSETVKPHDVFFLSNDYTPGNNYQAACRVHRLGQNNAVLVRTFVASGVALDQRVQQILNRKTNELNQIM